MLLFTLCLEIYLGCIKIALLAINKGKSSETALGIPHGPCYDHMLSK